MKADVSLVTFSDINSENTSSDKKPMNSYSTIYYISWIHLMSIVGILVIIDLLSERKYLIGRS